MTARGKRRAAQTPAAPRARSGGRNAATAAAARDLAESQRKANAAQTPVARAATQRVVEHKQRLYTPEANRQAAALVKPRTPSAAASTRAGKGRKGKPSR